MTLDQAKKHYFNESLELAMASEETIQKLATWLEKNGYDADLAWRIWESAKDEMEYLIAEA